MPLLHAAVWLDHQEAKIFHIDAEPDDAEVLHPRQHVRRHPAQTAERNHPADEQHFFHDVAKALNDADEILVLGPSTAKLELIKHVYKHDPTLEPKIVGVETVDHPTDRQLVAFVRRYFRAADRMLGTAP